MEFLAKKVHKEIGIPCFTPANGETVTINCSPKVTVNSTTEFLWEALKGSGNQTILHAALVAGSQLSFIFRSIYFYSRGWISTPIYR